MTLDDFRGKKIAVLGLGVNNRGLAQYLKQKGIDFEVIENWKQPDELIAKISDFEVIFRTPGLPFLSKPIQKAISSGAEVYSQTRLFFDLCPGKIIGVTGTKGKGTTATLIYKILKTAGKRAWLAGNIGQDPFEFLDKIEEGDLVVLELSSFQLQDMHKSPHIAVVLKTTSEHLDHHVNTQEYVQAKTNIVAHQSKSDFAVLNFDQETTRSFVDLVAGTVWWNSTETKVSPGCYISGEEIILDAGAENQTIMQSTDVGLIGGFNLENVTAGVAAAFIAGVHERKLIEKTVVEFKGLEHRLELAAEKKGVKFYNDSFATTPETTIAAISAFSKPLILIVGGSKKQSDYKELGRKIAGSQVKSLLAVGQTGPEIAGEARNAGFAGKIHDQGLDNMQAIVEKANSLAESGDTVLLSPAAASFDMFENYKQRGELFKKFIDKL